MNVTISYYLRPDELPYSIPQTEVVVKDEGVVKKPLGVASLGYNFVRLDVFSTNLVVVSYKLEKRGALYFLSVTFTDEEKRDLEGSWPYFRLLCTIADDENNRWQTAKYVLPGGDINICSRERANAVRRDGTSRPMISVTL